MKLPKGLSLKNKTKKQKKHFQKFTLDHRKLALRQIQKESKGILRWQHSGHLETNHHGQIALALKTSNCYEKFAKNIISYDRTRALFKILARNKVREG